VKTGLRSKKTTYVCSGSLPHLWEQNKRRLNMGHATTYLRGKGLQGRGKRKGGENSIWHLLGKIHFVEDKKFY